MSLLSLSHTGSRLSESSMRTADSRFRPSGARSAREKTRMRLSNRVDAALVSAYLPWSRCPITHSQSCRDLCDVPVLPSSVWRYPRLRPTKDVNSSLYPIVRSLVAPSLEADWLSCSGDTSGPPYACRCLP